MKEPLKDLKGALKGALRSLLKIDGQVFQPGSGPRRFGASKLFGFSV